MLASLVTRRSRAFAARGRSPRRRGASAEPRISREKVIVCAVNTQNPLDSSFWPRRYGADLLSPRAPPQTLSETSRTLNMPSVQSVYTSLSIISLGALIGMGVAVGSGVSMMSMAMYEEEEKNKMTASSVAEQSFRPAGRGFAASGAK